MSLLGLLRGAPAGNEERTLTDWGPWGSQSSATNVTEVTAFNLSAVWACQTLIADAISTMPVDVYRKTGDTREPIPAPAWIDTPNPASNRIDFDTQRILSLLGWGNAFCLLVRRGGSADPMAPVLERYVLDPWRVEIRSDGALPGYYVDGQYVESGRIQHIPGYRRPGQWKGMSVVQQARAGLSSAAAGEDLAKNIYENGLNTSGVISVPEMPADTAAATIERLQAKIREWYTGSKNSGKPLVLTGGTTWQPMSVTPADAQFLETRKFQVTEIARWFRVPPHMIGDVEKSTSWGTGIEQQSLGFVRYTLVPWIARLEASDSALLASPRFVRYNVNALIRADLKTRFESYQIARNGGWMSANEIRAFEDEAPIDNGDIYLQPLNFIEAGTEPAPTPAPGAPPGDPNGPL